MAEYSRIAKGSFTQAATGNAVPIILPFQPSVVRLCNYTASAAFAQHGIPSAYWDAQMGQGFAACSLVNSGPVLATAVVTSGGISTFGGGTLLQYGPQLTITAITQSSTAPQVTTSSAHGLSVGSVVVFQNLYQSSSTGQIQICGMPFVVASVGSTTTFTINYNNNVTGFTALSGSPTNPTPTCMQVLYPNLYAPNLGFIWSLTFGVGATGTGSGNYTLVKTTAPTNFQVGQEVAFRIPSNYGSVQLNSLPNSTIPGSPSYYYVTYVASSTSFVINTSGSGVTSFTTSVSFATAQAGGLTFPQVVAVGDNNLGSNQFGYNPPQFYNGTANVLANSPNGPAIAGAFCNNTSQGFIVGAGNAVYLSTPDTSSHLSGATSDVIYWEAYLPDYASP